jgi:hypothetical protein
MGSERRAPPAQGDISGHTKFSGTAAHEVKIYSNPKLGIRPESRGTPTYIKSDASG